MLYTRGHHDMAEFAADTATSSAPGQAFRYSSGDSNILSATLKGMLGHKAYVDYPWTALFQPLGIHNATWESDAEETFVASSYAYLTARDLARVGLLMQRDGRWGEQQLLPKEWVAFNRQPFDKYKALYVMPEKQLVIVRYGDDRDCSYRHNELLKRVLAAVQP
eukprot:gene23241-27638_t